MDSYLCVYLVHTYVVHQAKLCLYSLFTLLRHMYMYMCLHSDRVHVYAQCIHGHTSHNSFTYQAPQLYYSGSICNLIVSRTYF